MSVVANFTVPASEFALGRALDVGGGVPVRLASLIPTGEGVVPLFWIPRNRVEAARDALAADPSVDRVTVVEDRETEALLHVEWRSEGDGLVDALSASRGVVLDGVGRGDRWEFEVRFPDDEQLSDFYQHCRRSNVSLELTRIDDHRSDANDGGYGLTSEQRRAIVDAYEKGYFDVPRGTTLGELSEEMGISDSAASQRIRRGLSVLVAETLLSDPPGEYGTETDPRSGEYGS